MSNQEDVTINVKMQAINQHWQDIRHLEGMRLTFTSFLSAIFVASIAFISQTSLSSATTSATTEINKNYWTIYAALAVVSAVGCIISIRTWRAMDRCFDKAQQITYELIGKPGESVEEKEKIIKGLKSYIPYDEPAQWYHVWKLRIFFIWLYGVLTIIFLILAIWG